MATPTPGGAKTNLGLEPNIAGLLCYVPCCLGLVFSVVAAIVEKQSRFVRFHAFQSLLLHGVGIAVLVALQLVAAVLAGSACGRRRGHLGAPGAGGPGPHGGRDRHDDQGQLGRGARAAGDRADGPPVGLGSAAGGD